MNCKKDVVKTAKKRQKKASGTYIYPTTLLTTLHHCNTTAPFLRLGSWGSSLHKAHGQKNIRRCRDLEGF
jgi:hypothetical protein